MVSVHKNVHHYSKADVYIFNYDSIELKPISFIMKENFKVYYQKDILLIISCCKFHKEHNAEYFFGPHHMHVPQLWRKRNLHSIHVYILSFINPLHCIGTDFEKVSFSER